MESIPSGMESIPLGGLNRFYVATIKLHIQKTSECADHCIAFALSDPLKRQHQSHCGNQHNIIYDRCCMLQETVLKLLNIETINDLSEEMEFHVSKINDWISHILRTVNQDRCRVELLENLARNQAIIVMDWAMKFLPHKFIEKQSDWFGQKGLSWHVSVCIFRDIDGSLKHTTYVHLTDACRQDCSAVLCFLEHTMQHVKQQYPAITEIFLRSDNAGCYHCAQMWLPIPYVSEKLGIPIRQYDYSEAQSGKSHSDAKIAHMRRKMKVFVADGNDIISAMDMKAAIISGSGVAGCQVAVVTVDSRQCAFQHKWKGVNNVSNIKYVEGGGLIAFQNFEIGHGQIFTKQDLEKMSSQTPTSVAFEVVDDFSETIVSVKISHRPHMPGNVQQEAQLESMDGPTESPVVFYCSEEGCVKSFQSFSALEKHMYLGKHEFKLTRQSSYDKIRSRWANQCRAIVNTSLPVRKANKDSSSTTNARRMGWAMKKIKQTSQFSKKVKDYLNDAFNEGEKTGKKLTALNVSHRIRSEKDLEGNKKFSFSECLQPSQVSAYFSRMATLAKCQKHVSESRPQNTSKLEEDDIAAILAEVKKLEIKQAALEM